MTLNTRHLLLFALVLVFSCSDQDMTVDASDKFNKTAGEQFTEYIEGVSNDSLCILNYTTFMSGSDEIVEEETVELEELAVLLLIHTNKLISIEGHTDSQGDAAANLQLSKRRAEAVFDVLVANDIDSSRMQTVAYGEERPIANNGSAEGRELNRRVEIAILN